MSGTGGFAVSSRSHGGDRFYNPPAMRRQNQMLHQEKTLKQQQRHKLIPPETPAVNSNRRTEMESSSTAALPRPPPPALPSALPPVQPPVVSTNLDRLIESVCLSVDAEKRSEGDGRASRSREAELPISFCLGDLYETLKEWSAYGVGVPIKFPPENDETVQYYVPFLSGLQLYVDPSQFSSSERKGKSVKDEQNLLSQRVNKKPDEAVGEKLVFEYLETEAPYVRMPLSNKFQLLESQFPALKTFKSRDLLPSSWISISWYPIYRIPLGRTLKDLEACFLTFHPLSTNVKSKEDGSGRRMLAMANKGGSKKIRLPVFGLASYKLKKSILVPSGPHESEQESALLEAAANWVEKSKVHHPDYRFFRHHYMPWI